MPTPGQDRYARRIGRGLARGLTRSQARGHSRHFERSLRPPKTNVAIDEKLVLALRVFRATKNASVSAKTGHVSQESFRRFIREQGLADRSGRSWMVTDNLVREVDMISEGGREVVRVRGFGDAQTIELHNAAVRAFILSRDAAFLAPFVGEAVSDIAGREHRLETRPNVLLRRASSGGDGFEAVYRIII